MKSTDTVLSLLSLERPNFDGAIQIIRSAETVWGVQILDDHDPSTLPYALRIMVGDISLSTIRRRLRSWEALERITEPLSQTELSRIHETRLSPFLRTTGLDGLAHALHHDHCFVVGEAIIPWGELSDPVAAPQYLIERVRTLLQGRHDPVAQ